VPMANHKSDLLFLHPILHAQLEGMLAEIKNNLRAGWKSGTASEGIHRTPSEQFAIFQKGRAFEIAVGLWSTNVKRSQICMVTKRNRATIICLRLPSISCSLSRTGRNWSPARRNKRSARAQLNIITIGAGTAAAGRASQTYRG